MATVALESVANYRSLNPKAMTRVQVFRVHARISEAGEARNGQGVVRCGYVYASCFLGLGCLSRVCMRHV